MKTRSLPTALVMLAVCTVGGFAQSVPTGLTVIKLQLNLTDAAPKMDGATFPYVIQEVLNLDRENQSLAYSYRVAEISTGDPVSGVLASPSIGGWLYLFTTSYPNEFAVKMMAFLTKNGLPFGTRVTHLRFIGDVKTGAATGTCTVETFDLAGALLMSATGTVTGGLVSIDPIDDYREN